MLRARRAGIFNKYRFSSRKVVGAQRIIASDECLAMLDKLLPPKAEEVYLLILSIESSWDSEAAREDLELEALTLSTLNSYAIAAQTASARRYFRCGCYFDFYSRRHGRTLSVTFVRAGQNMFRSGRMTLTPRLLSSERHPADPACLCHYITPL